MPNSVKYFVFDIESVADPNLVRQIKYPGEDISPEEAIFRFREERMEKTGSDFLPYTFHVPTSIAVAKVDAGFELTDLVVLDAPQYRPHVMTEYFWRGWEKYDRPAFVTFNGRGFDIPLMELSAFRYGVSVPNWFATHARSFDQPRNRYNSSAHIDLCELLTNFGCTRFNGGLNLAASLLGKPGKMDVQGAMVQDMYDEGRLEEINDYCRCDVLDTYFVFLRTRVLIGDITLEREQELVHQAKAWIESRSEERAFRLYLEHWGEWENPWATPTENSQESTSDPGEGQGSNASVEADGIVPIEPEESPGDVAPEG